MPAPVVSVCIITYQHARYIAQAIEGVLAQRTGFPFEILVGEDASSDGTREICLDFARRFPDRVRVFLRQRKDVVLIDGQPRGSYNFRMTLREAQGEFIALCEGDDFWTDPEKLQRQVDYLRANPDCTGCFHDTQVVDGEGRVLQESYFQSEREKFTQVDVLETLLSRQATCSMMFRRAAFSEPLPAWYLRRPSDFYIDILLTAEGSLGFLPRNMAAYRKQPGGVWSGKRSALHLIELIIRYKLLLLEPDFLARYRDLLVRKIDELEALLFTPEDYQAEMRRLQLIVSEQTAAFELDQRELARLTQEAATAQRERAEIVTRMQGQIDDLLRQLHHLTAVSREQQGFVKVLTAERDRLAAELARDREEWQKGRTEAQHQIDDLRGQLDAVAATTRQQQEYIAAIKAERDRLKALSEQMTREAEQYVRVIDEQTSYIAALKRANS